jgi:NitT/TauT family transport system substrate-binding protein
MRQRSRARDNSPSPASPEHGADGALGGHGVFPHELLVAGFIKSGPNKIIAQGTDWRFFNELKKELKG